jgi:2-aminoethylphosphonate-pyruvate transaminase
MNSKPSIPASRDKLLFTPGPLTTSLSVKQAMLHDAGSWHWEFNALVLQLREKLLALAGVSRATGYEVIPMQGTGTFGVEAVLGSALPLDGKLLILSNGAYGERMALMAKHLRLDFLVQRTPENTPPDLAALERALQADPAITHVAVVHCETTTGILNPIDDVARVVQAAGRIYIVDAMSSFGAIPIDLPGLGIDYLISSANKCLEGVPGFSFVVARRAALLAVEGCARSLSLDLAGQLRGFEKNGQFRYTPPTHSVLAFAQALKELDDEGGIPARGARYARNQQVLSDGMRQIGFRPYLPADLQSCIITSFYFPDDPRFTFEEFYRRLSDKGFIIYPGKISQANLFRIGSIGRLFESDIRSLLAGVREAVAEMGVQFAAASPEPSAAPEPAFAAH